MANSRKYTRTRIAAACRAFGMKASTVEEFLELLDKTSGPIGRPGKTKPVDTRAGGTLLDRLERKVEEMDREQRRQREERGEVPFGSLFPPKPPRGKK
jgi:hypothetical protein